MQIINTFGYMKKLVALAVTALMFIQGTAVAQKKASIDYKAGFFEVPYFQNHSRDEKAPDGHAYIKMVQDTGFWEMEDMTIAQILSGNMPSALKKFRKIDYTVVLSDYGQWSGKHKVEMWVLPDYLSIGNDADYVRMPMGPLGAQRVADSLYCSLPTTFLVDRIAEAAEGRIEIFPFRPVGDRNMKPLCFEDSNNAINALMRSKGLKFGQFVSGLKKDVVLTTRLENEAGFDRHVAIYGWHHPDGHPQQPLFIRHGNFYSDYSHGIRLIYRTIKIDGKEYDLRKVLEDPFMFRIVSDESVPFKRASYDWQKPWYFTPKK